MESDIIKVAKLDYDVADLEYFYKQRERKSILTSFAERIGIKHYHDVEKFKKYTAVYNQYYYVVAYIGKCTKCQNRVLIRQFSVRTAKSGHLIEKVFSEYGIYESWKEQSRWGSWWYCEMPESLALMMQNNGEEYAENYLNNLLKSNGYTKTKTDVGSEKTR